MGQFNGWKTQAALQQYSPTPATPPDRKKRRGLNPETKLQIDVVTWFRAAFPRESMYLSASVAGVARSSRLLRILMAKMGYQKGWPDLTLAYPRGQYHGLYVEVKTLDGKPGASQPETLERLRMQGYYADFGYGFNQCIHILTQYMALGAFQCEQS